MLTAIVAVSEGNIIGMDNKIPWHIPDDLKRFKSLTMGHCIIMGRKTFESLPRLLPDRKHIVLSRKNINHKGAVVVKSLDRAFEEVRADPQPFVIGGGEIYRLMMPFLKKIELTRVHHIFNGDTTFPHIDMDEWKLTAKEHHKNNASQNFDVTYETYLR